MAGGGGGESRGSLDKKSRMQRHGAKDASGGKVSAKKQKKDDDDDNDEIAASSKKSTTLEELIDAVSEDDDDVEGGEDEDDEDEDEDGEDEKRAQALRKMIRDGKFDQLLKPKASNAKDDEDEDEEDKNDDQEKEMKDEKYNCDEDDDADSSDDDDDDEDNSNNNEKGHQQVRHRDTSNNNNNNKAFTSSVRSLALHTSALAADRHLPWPESFAVTALAPLPFTSDATITPSSTKTLVAGEVLDEFEEAMDTVGGVDVHDDLAREVAFYDTALECTTLAREQCDKFGIPFARPEDFFAEMIKSDDHMAKIKDRLIYETKKMDAVQRRKSNKEHTLMAKERNAHRLAEKAKDKKAHMSAVDDWKKDVERNRGRHVGDSKEDDGHLRGMISGGRGGLNKRRESANKRHGFGGKNGRFKQNDRATLNDMSGFNPRGGFAGGGRKSPGGAGGGKKRPSNNSGGSGKKRPGKRARDSARSR